MSRLTSSLFHKLSPSDTSLLISSPPESHPDTVAANPAILQDLGINNGFANTSPESAGTRLRKPPSIPYLSSSLRDNKEKGQRSGKPLILVFPPPTLVYDHGHDAHTLSNGPFHRLSEGVTMPLFPSMITQLAAIAREFNFPSTSGLCVYFHHVEDGLISKPRISDDSWPSIWSYLSDPPGPNERRPLFSGKFEFDIDLRLARWYASWLSTIHRELADYHAYTLPPTGTSLAHFREESQATLPEGRSFDIDVAEYPFTQLSEHNRRHVPRRLSLAERFDLVPVRPDLKSSSRSALFPPDGQSAGSQVLSTVIQEEEPKTLRDTLDTRVMSWREGALLIPNPLTATGQTSLDPANLPNDMPINNELLSTSAELKMEDFTWSISSAGPESCDSPSSFSEAHVPSVHLASRIAGTVCSTPSVCTSFGPDSSESICISPMSWGRAPSVHIASRLAGSVCTSPSICTSFGPDDDVPPSPFLDIRRVSTPDLAHRFYESVPSTPQTATTWGAPLSYPPSPRCLSPSPSLDLGERSMSVEFAVPLPSRLSHDPSVTTVWPYVWPYIDEYSNKSRLPAVASHDGTIDSTSSYPYLKERSMSVEFEVPLPSRLSQDPSGTTVWPYVWPYIDECSTKSRLPHDGTIASTSSYPYLKERSMSVEFEVPLPSRLSQGPSGTTVWPYVWPYIDEYSTKSRLPAVASHDIRTIDSTSSYPYLKIYSPIYPHLEIYPAIPGAMIICPPNGPVPSSNSKLDINFGFKIPFVYPSFDIYPAVYPFNLQQIYPSIPVSIISEDAPDPISDSPLEIKVEIKIPCVYPSFDMYPAVYPSNLKEIYPAIVTQSYPVELSEDPTALNCPIVQDVALEADISQSIHLRKYPIFNIYPAVYPFFDLYPAIEEHKEADAPSHGFNCELSLSMTIESVYPNFNLYPSVYPHLEIYPVHHAGAYQPALEQDTIPSKEDVYFSSACTSLGEMVNQRERWTLSIFMETGYPSFNLYKAVYPHFDIYPTHYAGGWSQGNLEQGEEQSNKPSSYTLATDPTLSRDLSQPSWLTGCTYPFFNLYPALYPHFDLYPAPGAALSQPATPKLPPSSPSIPNTVEPSYPTFNLYPAVYPYFDLYLSLPEKEIESPSALKKKQTKSSSRLTHSELHAMVMMEIIEPARLFGQMESRKKFGDGHLGLDVHEHTGPSTIRKMPSLSSHLRDRLGGGGTRGFLQHVERRTEIPQRKVENIGEPNSSRSPGRRDNVVWQRIKAFDLNGGT